MTSASRLQRVVMIVLALWVLGALVGVVCWGAADAQQIVLDTSTAQYKANTRYVDSLVTGPFVMWARRFRLTNWRITVRADSLAITTAETYVNEPYKNAVVVFDVRRMATTDANEIFVHELWHVKLSPYTEFAGNFFDGHDGGPLSAHLRLNEERLVTDLTRTLLWRP